MAAFVIIIIQCLVDFLLFLGGAYGFAGDIGGGPYDRRPLLASDEAASGLYAAAAVSAAEREVAARVMAAVGSVVWVDDEARIDAVTALSGSGPAYVFLFIEALQQAAADLGIAPEEGRRLAVETVLGAARLAAQSSEPASVLRERVTSKGGTTEAALRVMAERGVKDGIVAGVMAANARGSELGAQLGKD